MHPVNELFNKLPYVEPYPVGMKKIENIIPGLAFFPGGWGLWIDEGKRPIFNSDDLPPMPVGGVMVLGQDFDSEESFKKSFQNGSESEKSPTWRNLIGLLGKAGVKLEKCFFTNAYMGIRRGDKATGISLATKDKDFVKRCRHFFINQLRVQKPSVILVLGKQVTEFLSPLSDGLLAWKDLKSFVSIDNEGCQVIKGVRFNQVEDLSINVVALVHPSMRTKNAGNRKFDRHTGQEAEVYMIKRALF